jgi:hypothetical protein
MRHFIYAGLIIFIFYLIFYFICMALGSIALFQAFFWKISFYLGSRVLSFALFKCGCSGSLAFAIVFSIRTLLSREAAPFGANMIGANSDPSSSAGWTDFDEGVLLESSSETENSSVNQPEARSVLPPNPVASGGEEAGPSNRAEPYPYLPDQVIGGDSTLSIRHRLLNFEKDTFPSFEDIQWAHIKAEDLFEVKVEIIQKMAVLDPTGDWMGQGARALDNPRTATGEPSLEQLYAILTALNEGGVQSKTFADLKSRIGSNH